MGTFTIDAPNGKQYTIEGDNAAGALAALQAHLGATEPQPDKYQQAAQQDIARAGSAAQTGYTRRLVHGATLGADNTIMAALLTPAEMIRRGIGPSEAYNYAKAREDQELADARTNTGMLGTAAEVLGGGVTGGGLAKGGVTFSRFLAPEAGLIKRSLASAADSSVLGGFAGGMEGNGLQERATNAAKGLSGGALVGGAAPFALSGLGAAVAPIVSNFKARINPQGFAQGQVARAIHESGVSPQDLSLSTVQAANEGQPQFMLSDAMGNAGQRMLSTVARAPGDGRTAVVNALDSRQAGQGRRVANAVNEGFGTSQSGAQTEAALTRARDATANTEYGQIRNDANPVDISNVISRIDETLNPGVNQIARPQSGIANDTTEAALQGIRSRLTDGRSSLTDFTAVQRVRGDLKDAVVAAERAGAGNRARLLGGVLRELDGSMENASSGFRQANANFAQASRNIDAVQAGRDAAMQGRTEDTIPAFQALTPQGQQAFRSGYVDPHIASTQGAAFGVNKARPLINDAFEAESNVMAPGAQMMQRRLGREQTMFETRAQALGGSKTADNLNDHAAMGVDPHIIGQVVTGNWHGALKSALAAGSNAVTGNTPAVRREVANILLQNGANLSPSALQKMVDDTVSRIQFVQNMARGVGRGAAGGLAVTMPSITGGAQNKAR